MQQILHSAQNWTRWSNMPESEVQEEKTTPQAKTATTEMRTCCMTAISIE